MMWTFTFGLLLLLQHFFNLQDRHTRKGSDPMPPSPSRAGITIGIMFVVSEGLSSLFSTHSPVLVRRPEHSEQSGPDQSPSQLETTTNQSTLFALSCGVSAYSHSTQSALGLSHKEHRSHWSPSQFSSHSQGVTAESTDCPPRSALSWD